MSTTGTATARSINRYEQVVGQTILYAGERYTVAVFNSYRGTFRLVPERKGQAEVDVDARRAVGLPGPKYIGSAMNELTY